MTSSRDILIQLMATIYNWTLCLGDNKKLIWGSLNSPLSQMAGILPDIFNTLRPRPNRRHFPDDIFKSIFLNENVWISIKISLLKFVPKLPITNIPALVQILTWRRSGDKPLSEPMMDNLLTHICVTWPQWVKGCYNVGINSARWMVSTLFTCRQEVHIR